MRLFVFAGTLATGMLAASTAGAISSYQNEVPNGTEFRCLTCHERSGGGEGWNEFGQAILVAGDANPAANPNDQNLGFDAAVGTPADYWLDICGLDSDGDGASNGEELRDANCDDVVDDEEPPSNPGDIDSVPTDPGDPAGGGGEDPGGCSTTGVTPSLLTAAAIAVVALVRRRKRA